MVAVACDPSSEPRHPARERSGPRRARPPPRPPSASYEALDGRAHYYAVVRLEPFEDHFTATFHHIEGAYCTLTASAARGVTLEGCGFPSSVPREDRVPEARRGLLPALRDAVFREEPDATSLRFRYDGTYRSVYLEEEVPCAGKHGNGYNRVELRYDERLLTILERKYLQGSLCGAAPFYWASPEPKWLQYTSPRTLLSIDAAAEPLPPALLDSLRAVLASPEGDHSVPPALPP
jgi:hypothetical protein